MGQKKEEQQKLTMAEPNRKLHVAMFPWLAFGHIIPYLELAKLITQRGHKISFISTPKNIHSLPTNRIPFNLQSQINFISLSLPPVEHLPDNAEATSDLPFDKIPYLKIAYDGLHGPLLHFLKTSTPDWIIYDFAAHWLPPITADLGISSAFFSIFAAWTISFFGSSSAMISGDDPRTKPEDFTVPPEWIPFPSKVAYRLHEAKRIFDNLEVNNSGVSDVFRAGSVIAGVDVIAIRSCNELESDFLRLVSQLHGKPTLPLGLLPPSAVEGNSTDEEEDTWIRIREWLDDKNKGCVVYIAFGSELELSQDVINELALGLELSRLPFFWALRKPKNSSVELPDGFEERVKDRGLVWTSWAPQLKILSHESVGGFMTHCGLSSVVEALQFELPLILLPFSLDQGLNARIFEEKKVGVEVERDENDGSFTKESVANSLRLIMVDKEGLVYRENAKEMKKLFADKDLHNQYIDQFVLFLQNHRVACSKDPSPAST